MFPVLYTFNGVGETVYVGRDKKKCGVSLPVDAQGVSRVHGSFKWTSQGSTVKRKNVTVGIENDNKRSKLSVKTTNRTGAHQSQQCIFAENRLPTSSRKTMILAEDTQLRTSRLQDATYGAGDRSSVTMSVPETCKQRLVVKRVISQPIFESVKFLFSFFNGFVHNFSEMKILFEDVTVLASSTLPKRTGSNTSATKRKSASEKKTSIFDSRPAKKRPTFPTVDENFSDDEVDVRIEEPEAESTVRCTSSFAQKISASPIRSTCATSEVIPRKSARGAVKKSIFSQMPPKKQQQGTLDKVDERFPGEDTEFYCGSTAAAPPQQGMSRDIPCCGSGFAAENGCGKDILKLVSTGKRYDVRAEEDEDEDDQGVEIERVVAKLNNLVHYADIERPPRPRPAPQLDVSSGSNSANFKRFRKASQGRFNASLSSAKRPCVIGGSDDLVDFRQLPHGA
ncbi:unnamed protein product [Nippostrongylus brasiliensis]|uniref:FHA domain-containing protein n=1 Tax=Nippostrongylus brasiliensis TaxID=27835 RepID=A0A158QX12_NIPBR|nr:unnamed protein product [Nippostrongylus brasiliensis]